MGFTFFVVALCMVLIFSNYTHTEQNNAQRVGEKYIYLDEQVKPGIPIRLRIPKINIDVPIESLGLTALGAVDVTDNPINVAWFNLGPRPGEGGLSIISGHSGWKNQIPAVFDNLYKLEIVDKVYIEDENEKTITFVVRKFHTYSPTDDTSDVFISGDRIGHVNLITCTGSWNKNQKSPNDRFVVFTDREIE